MVRPPERPGQACTDHHEALRLWTSYRAHSLVVWAAGIVTVTTAYGHEQT